MAAGSLVLPTSTALAQSISQGGIIEEIRVEGSQRVDPETIRTYMGVNPGDSFNPITLDESLKSIFATGLFADVTLQRDGPALIVKVTENPVINRIAFEGNKRIDDEALGKEISLRPRVVFTRTRVQQDVQRILDLYRRRGRFGATVDPKVIQLPQNRVDLAFEINEGPTTGIESINFIGNRVFSDGSLREEIATRETAWYRFLSSDDSYDPDRLAFDRELLRRFYLSEGYADFRVVSAVAELNQERSAFIITFSVEEGPRYKFGTVDLFATLKDLDPEVLRSNLETVEGDWYDATAIDESIEVMTREVGNLGYAFVDIRPRTKRDRENFTINLTYDIQEGPKVFVERIDIQGNVRTLDKVIRREFRLVEGDAFNSSRMRRSRQRIENLGFFQTVTVDNKQGSAPDKTVITVDVEEQSTGDITFGAGLSTEVGILGNIQFRERNLLGRGQDLRLGLVISGTSSEIDLSFTEPYFLDRNVSAGFDLFRTTSDNIEESSFKQKRLGGGLRAGYNLTEHTRQLFRYTIEQREILDVQDDASLAIKEEEGKTIRSTIAHDIIWDRRNSKFNTKSGYMLSMTNQFTGVGGDVTFLKNSAKGEYYYPILDSLTLKLGADIGSMFGIGQDTRVSDRFFLGGNSFRGFKVAGLGPRDIESGDALGGKHYYKTTAELHFPLGLPEEYDIRGRLFTDIGSLWDYDGQSAAGVNDSSSVRVAIGPGFSWNSPFGLINLDFGFPVLKEDFDKTSHVTFSFGTQF
ncbi:outer membrane protein assembly factor BamA [Rhodovibrionaceae bacterium A322]